MRERQPPGATLRLLQLPNLRLKVNLLEQPLNPQTPKLCCEPLIPFGLVIQREIAGLNRMPLTSTALLLVTIKLKAITFLSAPQLANERVTKPFREQIIRAPPRPMLAIYLTGRRTRGRALTMILILRLVNNRVQACRTLPILRAPLLF